MCGILLHKRDGLKKEDFFNSLTQLNHRGPDSINYQNFNDLYIGHTRLSIIDLSDNGSQPMTSNCNKYILSFNGEIYNFKEIKKDLVLKGYNFNSNTDSEVILNGFIEYKNKIFKKLNGIFSIIIYDKVSDIITISRDSFGVKPLYYFIRENEILLSSEIRVFNKYSEEDPISKILFLSHGYLPTPNTTLKNVFSLKPGHYAKISNFKITFFKFFDIKSLFQTSKNSILNDKIVYSAVKNQLISDAKIGCFLSGGLDSSVLAYCASKYIEDIETYSINFRNSEDEKKFQRALIDKFSLSNKEKTVDYSDFKIHINKFLNHMDMPTVDGFNTYLVSKLAKENGSKVAFSGIGSDEIFFGYPSYRKLGLLRFIKVFSKILPFRFLPSKYKKLDYLKLNSDYGVYMSKRAIFSIYEISKILEIDKEKIIKTLNEYSLFANSNLSNFTLIEKIAYYEITKYMEGQLLKDADVFGMANSIEIRVPFLDINLVEAVLKIQSDLKLKSKYNKGLLINLFEGIIPKMIYQREKKGFELPYDDWINKSGIKKRIRAIYGKKLNLGSLHWSKIWALHILNIKIK